MKTKGILLASLLSIFNFLNAQTGSISVSIPFQNSSRNLACFIPPNYDSLQTYQLMICLHGLGDNSNNYRNSLINTLKWPTLFPNTIFICPDGGDDKNKDFYQPAGDEAFILAALNYGLHNYTINPNKILLQGFSLGGRSALKFALDNPGKANGLLLNTPAIQGLSDLENDPRSSLQFNYNNAKNLPIFITVGGTDYSYAALVNSLSKKLKRHNAAVSYNEFSSLGHSIPSNTLLKSCPDFFIKPNKNHFDADLFETTSGTHFCNTSINSEILVRNNGDSSIRTLNFSLSAGANLKTTVWNGLILPNEHVKISIPYTFSAGGTQNFKVTISSINQSNNDDDTLNNTLLQSIEMPSDKMAAFVNEGFETAKPFWSIKDNGGPFGWYIDSDVKKSGKNSIGTFNTIFLFYSLGSKESFSSPMLDISSLSYKELSFDLAFNYVKFTPPYVTAETIFTDTLEVLISTDCGKTFTSLYKKWGQNLASTANPILNPLSLAASFFTPKKDEWRKEVIDLSKFSQAKNAIIKFECISGMGGSINIDNLNAGWNNSSISKPKFDQNFKLYPNPASHNITIQLPNSEQSLINIIDLSGKIVYTKIHNDSEQISVIDIQSLPAGFYSVEVNSNNFHGFQKLSIVR
jgi:predicted esterase